MKTQTMPKSHLIQRLTLSNLMLHQQTSIQLDRSSITLITGANGSGKTQLLDALILALGYHPRRTKKGHLQELIGAFGDTAQIELSLANPRFEGVRAMRVEDPDLARLTDCDHFQIVVTINRASGLSYTIRAQDKRHKILRRDVRQLFASQGIRADNKLAFTEEGTVNVFADHSGRSKFDLFLETTGLATYRENLLRTLDKIQDAHNAVVPLQRKLALEKEYLLSLEKARQMAQERRAMEAQLQNLQIEEKWAQVVPLEKEVQDLQDKIATRRQKLAECESQRQEILQELQEHTEQEQACAQELEQARLEQEQTRNRLRKLDGMIQSKQEQRHKLERKIQRLQSQHAQLMEAGQQIEHLRQEITQTQQAVNQSRNLLHTIGPHFFESCYQHEQEILVMAVKFGEQLSQAGLALLGPLFSCCQPRPEQCSAAQLARLLGEYFFTYLATDQTSFQAAVELWRQHHSEPAPPFGIVLVTSPAAPTELEQYLTAPPVVLHFLENICKRRLVVSQTSWQHILEEAQQKQQHLYQEQMQYLPWPGLITPWHIRIITPGLQITYQQVQQALRARQTHERHCAQLQQLQAEYEKLHKQTVELEFINNHLVELQEESAEIQVQLEEFAALSEEVSQQHSTFNQTYHELAAKLHKRQSIQQQLKRSLAILEREQQNLERIASVFAEELTTKKQQLAEFTKVARLAGARPATIRPLEQVSQEKSHLQGRLDSLQVSPVSEKMYLEQKDKVQRLSAELAGTANHLANLQQDMQQRFDDWHQEVLKRVTEISQTMDQLLSGVFAGARLRLQHINLPEKTTLEVQVRRSDKYWRDLATLSGGEKVLVVEALILAFHLQTDAPLHAIDECTQRLDLEFKAYAFQMVYQAVELAMQRSGGPFAPQFILLAPDTLGVQFAPEVSQAFHRVVVTPARTKRAVKVKLL